MALRVPLRVDHKISITSEITYARLVTRTNNKFSKQFFCRHSFSAVFKARTRCVYVCGCVVVVGVVVVDELLQRTCAGMCVVSCSVLCVVTFPNLCSKLHAA